MTQTSQQTATTQRGRRRPTARIRLSRVLLVGASLLLSTPLFAADPPARFRQWRLDAVVQDDGTAVETTHFELAVANDDAARGNAQWATGFSDAIEQMTLIEAYTQMPDGRRVPIDPTAVRTELAPGTPNVPEFSDRKRMVLVFPDAQAGDVFVATWRRTITHPAIPGEYSFYRDFARTLPWDNVEVTITTPADKKLHTEAHGPVLDETTAPDGRHVYHWHYSAPDARTEDRAALLKIDRAPRLFASTFPDWAAFSREYAAAFAPETAITPRLQALADQVTAGITDRRQQAERLYDWVSMHIRWVAIYLGNGGLVPHTADSVLGKGYGDCKDQVALLMALLRAKGIAAEPVLINLFASYTMSGAPTFVTFNHVITYLPEWNLYADTTPGGAPFGTLPLSEYGKPVLHVTAAGAAPSRIAPLAPDVATEHLRTTATLAADGAVSGTSATDAAGPYAVTLHAIGRGIEGEGEDHFVARRLRSLDHSGKGGLVPFTADGTAPDMRIAGWFHLERQPGWLDGDSFRLPIGLRLLLRPGDGPIGLMFQRDVPATEPTPCYAARQQEELSLELPPGYRPERLPKDRTVDGSFFHYESHWTFAQGTVAVQRSFVSTIDQPVCDGARRVAAAHALTLMYRDLEQRISLEKSE